MTPASATATAVRVGGDDKQTRFVMDLDHKVDIAAFTLADPYRIVLDLPQVTFDLPAKAGAQGRGLIKEFRYGLIMAGGSRIVLDTKGPVRVERAFVMAAADGQPARLVIELAFTGTLRDRLAQSGKYRVLMTRGDDSYIPLNDRVRFARAHNASLFISVHADSLPKKEGQADGATI